MVGQVKELAVGVSHQTALCGPCGCKRGGDRSAPVYLPSLLFTLEWAEQVGSEETAEKIKDEETDSDREEEK